MKGQFMKKSFFLTIVCITAMAALMLTACDPEGTAQRNHLGWILNTSEAPQLSVDQLMDSIKAYNDAGGPQMPIPFTLTDIDVQPRAHGRYVNEETGSSLTFNLGTTDDADYSIGTVEMDLHGQFVMGAVVDREPETGYVQPRGKSVYTIYTLAFTEADSTATDSLACDTIPTTIPKRWWVPALLYVYPSGDSIITTSGHECSTHLFILE